MKANLSWVEPSNVAAKLREARDGLARLAQTRKDLSPETAEWLENLDAVIAGVEAYTNTCQTGAEQVASAAGATQGMCGLAARGLGYGDGVWLD